MPTTSNFGWTTPADTDLVKDGAAAIRTLGNGVDSSFVDLKGGTSGQILAKNSNTDLDFVWVANDQGDITAVTAGTGISGGGTSGAVTITNSMATEITAKGDLIVGTGSGTFDNLPAGTNGYTLVADSSVSPTGLKWAVDPVADVITTAGDLIYGTAADTVARLGIGTAGQVLKVNSGATAPEWGSVSSSPSFVGCSLTKSAAQTITNNSSTALTFNTETFDTDGFHDNSTNTSRITIPSGKGGKYLFVMTMCWTTNATGERLTTLKKNGGFHKYTWQMGGISGGYIFNPSSVIVDATAGDYFEMFGFQTSGGNLNIVEGFDYTTFSCVYLGA